MIVQGRDTPAPHHEKPAHQNPAHPANRKPAAKNQKPAHQKPSKPAAHKPRARPSKPERGKRSAGRDEFELIWFDVEYAPLAKGGHIH